MRRRVITLSPLLALAGVGASELPAAAKHRAPKPNIVVVLTDDQTIESMRVMPDTAQLLAGHGTTFRNNFASYPLCCPSRATYLTGQYAHNHGVRSNSNVDGGFKRLDGDETLPYDTPNYAAVRTQRYMYAEYSTGDAELYDLDRDPFELESRHDDPAYARARARLGDQVDRLEDCAGDECR